MLQGWGNDSRSSCFGSSIRSLRLWLQRHRASDIRCWDNGGVYHLLLRSWDLSLPPRHIGDAASARVQEGCELVHGHCHRCLLVLQSRRVQVVRQMGCLAFTGQRWAHGEEGRIWNRPHWTVCQWRVVCPRQRKVHLRRNSRHLQANSAVHWGTWLGCVASMSVISFLIASGVPIFNYLLSLAGSVAFAPLALGLPGWLWIHDHADYRKGTLWQKTMYMLHIVLILISVFLTIGGTYGVIVQILNAYRDGLIDSAFSCADNSNSS
jgi:hypothetical protein